MKVFIADKCGFCQGVRTAIATAEKTLQSTDKVYSLGPIIHNNDVVNRLSELGLETVDGINDIPGGTVLIRSHGVAREELKRIEQRKLDIVDATCVLVKRVQDVAKNLEDEGYQVVIIGDPNHPEVISIKGNTTGSIVLENKEEIQTSLPKSGKLALLCQTTQSYKHFAGMVAAIMESGFSELKVVNTLCREALKRQSSAMELSQKVDAMFVLGGKHSANTKKLAELCKLYNRNVYHLQNISELKESMLDGVETAGITAGASTPDWVIQGFAEHLKNL